MDDGRRTVLVVDDTPENIRVLAAILGGRYRVKAAPNGEKALAICAADPPPDLVFLDVEMPGLDGREVCRRLKADPRTAGIPVVFVTGTLDEVERARARTLGAADCLAKPVDPAALLARAAALT